MTSQTLEFNGRDGRFLKVTGGWVTVLISDFINDDTHLDGVGVFLFNILYNILYKNILFRTKYVILRV